MPTQAAKWFLLHLVHEWGFLSYWGALRITGSSDRLVLLSTVILPRLCWPVLVLYTPIAPNSVAFRLLFDISLVLPCSLAAEILLSIPATLLLVPFLSLDLLPTSTSFSVCLWPVSVITLEHWCLQLSSEWRHCSLHFKPLLSWNVRDINLGIILCPLKPDSHKQNDLIGLFVFS